MYGQHKIGLSSFLAFLLAQIASDCHSTCGDLGELGTFSRREAVPSNLDILADLVISADAHNAVRARSHAPAPLRDNLHPH